MMAKKRKLSRLAQGALAEHILRRQASLREHLKLKPKSWAGVNPEYRQWWERRLRFFEMREDCVKHGPFLADHSYGSVIEWMELKQAEQAAIDAAVVGALRRSRGAPKKHNRDSAMLKEFEKRRPQSTLSNSQLAETIGKNFGLKRRASIEAIARAKKLRKKRV